MVLALRIGVWVIQVELHTRTVVRLVATSGKPIGHQRVPLRSVILDQDPDTSRRVEAAIHQLDADFAAWGRARGDHEGDFQPLLRLGCKVGVVFKQDEVSRIRSHQSAGPGPCEKLAEEPPKQGRIIFVGADVPNVSERRRRQATHLNVQLDVRHRDLLVASHGAASFENPREASSPASHGLRFA